MSLVFVVFCVFHCWLAGVLGSYPLQSFRYEPCTAPYTHPGLLELRDLSIQNAPGGNWKLSGKVVLFVPIRSPVQAVVHLERKIMGVSVPMLCIDNFGSCTYPDLCDLGVPQGDSCPTQLAVRGYPCRCPFEPGRYNIPGLVFPISSAIVKGRFFGTHYGRITISQGDSTLACYQFVTRM